jgi:hypothetical protein
MKSLSKQDIVRRDDIIRRLRDRWSVFERYQEEVKAAMETAQQVLDAYREVIDEAQGFADDMSSSIGEYMSKRSDKWLDGENGEKYQEWQDAWSDIDLTDTTETLELPEQPDPEDIINNLLEGPIEP